MAALPDHWIKKMARTHRMIVPFSNQRKREGKISFGASSYGYDFRLAERYMIPDFSAAAIADPKKMDFIPFQEFTGRSCLIPPNSFILGRSLEYFRIPRDIVAVCYGKSTYARCGLIVNVTPLEPAWEGYITISLANASPVPVKVYSGEGVAQIIFIRAESECTTSYADRKGKYQAQNEIRLARV